MMQFQELLVQHQIQQQAQQTQQQQAIPSSIGNINLINQLVANALLQGGLLIDTRIHHLMDASFRQFSFGSTDSHSSSTAHTRTFCRSGCTPESPRRKPSADAVAGSNAAYAGIQIALRLVNIFR